MNSETLSTTTLPKPEFKVEELTTKEAFDSFGHNLHSYIKSLTDDQKEQFRDFIIKFTALAKAAAEDPANLTEEELSTLSGLYPTEAVSQNPVVKPGPAEKVEFEGEEIAAPELEELRQEIMREMRASLEEINRKHVNDAMKRPENGGIKGYAALYGNLQAIGNLIKRLENGESVSSEDVQKIKDLNVKFDRNLKEVREAIKEIKDGKGTDPVGPDRSVETLKTEAGSQKDEVVSKIQAKSEADFPHKNGPDEAYVVTKERMLKAAERAYSLYTFNLNVSISASPKDKAELINTAKERFAEAMRLLDPENTEVKAALDELQFATADHQDKEAQYHDAHALSLDKNGTPLDPNLKREVTEALKNRVQKETKAYELLAAMRGMKFSEDARRATLGLRTTMAAIRERKQAENEAYSERHPRIASLKQKAGKIIGLPMSVTARVNSYFDTKKEAKIKSKVAKYDDDKLEGAADERREDRVAATVRKKFENYQTRKKWGIRVGSVAIYGVAGGLTGGLLAGAIAGGTTMARIGGGMAGAGLAGSFSLWRESGSRNERVSEGKNARQELKSSLAALGDPALEKKFENMVAAEERIQRIQNRRGATMFVGGLIGGLGTGAAANALELGSIGTQPPVDDPLLERAFDAAAIGEERPDVGGGFESAVIVDNSGELAECEALSDRLDEMTRMMEQLLEENGAGDNRAFVEVDRVEAVEPLVNTTEVTSLHAELPTYAAVRGDNFWDIMEGDRGPGQPPVFEHIGMDVDPHREQALIDLTRDHINAMEPAERTALGFGETAGHLQIGAKVDLNELNRIAKEIADDCGWLESGYTVDAAGRGSLVAETSVADTASATYTTAPPAESYDMGTSVDGAERVSTTAYTSPELSYGDKVGEAPTSPFTAGTEAAEGLGYKEVTAEPVSLEAATTASGGVDTTPDITPFSDPVDGPVADEVAGSEATTVSEEARGEFNEGRADAIANESGVTGESLQNAQEYIDEQLTEKARAYGFEGDIISIQSGEGQIIRSVENGVPLSGGEKLVPGLSQVENIATIRISENDILIRGNELSGIEAIDERYAGLGGIRSAEYNTETGDIRRVSTYGSEEISLKEFAPAPEALRDLENVIDVRVINSRDGSLDYDISLSDKKWSFGGVVESSPFYGASGIVWSSEYGLVVVEGEPVNLSSLIPSELLATLPEGYQADSVSFNYANNGEGVIINVDPVYSEDLNLYQRFEFEVSSVELNGEGNLEVDGEPVGEEVAAVEVEQQRYIESLNENNRSAFDALTDEEQAALWDLDDDDARDAFLFQQRATVVSSVAEALSPVTEHMRERSENVSEAISGEAPTEAGGAGGLEVDQNRFPDSSVRSSIIAEYQDRLPELEAGAFPSPEVMAEVLMDRTELEQRFSAMPVRYGEVKVPVAEYLNQVNTWSNLDDQYASLTPPTNADAQTFNEYFEFERQMYKHGLLEDGVSMKDNIEEAIQSGRLEVTENGVYINKGNGVFGWANSTPIRSLAT